MAKKEKIKMETALPNNIVPIGESSEEKKKIYIRQDVYKEIHAFSQKKTDRENGGVLLGNVMEEFGVANIVIQGFIEAKYSEATATTLKFTHETWDYIHETMEKKYEDAQIVGWIHTHPDFGIFLSEYDLFIQKNFFNEEYQVAYVVDPIRKKEGFFLWVNESIERSKGFFVYDEIGASIDLSKQQEEDDKEVKRGDNTKMLIAVAALIVVVFILMIANINLSNRLSILEKKHESLVETIAENNVVIQQNLYGVQGTVSELQADYDNLYQTISENSVVSENNISGMKEE